MNIIEKMKEDRAVFAEYVLGLTPGTELYESYVRGEWDRCIYSKKHKPLSEWFRRG